LLCGALADGSGKCPVPNGAVPLRASVPVDMPVTSEEVDEAERALYAANDVEALAAADLSRLGQLAPLVNFVPAAPRYRTLTPAEHSIPMSDVRRRCPRTAIVGHTCNRNCVISIAEADAALQSYVPPNDLALVPRRGIFVNHSYSDSMPCRCESGLKVKKTLLFFCDTLNCFVMYRATNVVRPLVAQVLARQSVRQTRPIRKQICAFACRAFRSRNVVPSFRNAFHRQQRRRHRPHRLRHWSPHRSNRRRPTPPLVEPLVVSING
jgi:hypothetical protein